MEPPKDQDGKPVPAFEVLSADPDGLAGGSAEDSLSPEEREAAAQFLRESFRVLPEPEKPMPKSSI